MNRKYTKLRIERLEDRCCPAPVATPLHVTNAGVRSTEIRIKDRPNTFGKGPQSGADSGLPRRGLRPVPNLGRSVDAGLPSRYARIARRHDSSAARRTNSEERLESALADMMGEHYRKAFQLLRSQSVRRALDISQEPTALRERYGLRPHSLAEAGRDAAAQRGPARRHARCTGRTCCSRGGSSKPACRW